MRILIHDFGGYGFPLQLSGSLARRGHEVGHAYCASLTTTPSTVGSGLDSVCMLPLHTASPLDKYKLLKRWQQEREYGRRVAEACLQFSPQAVISANTPLSAQARLLALCRKRKIPFVFWLQDLIGLAAYRLLRRKLWPVGISVGGYFRMLESRLLRRSDRVICISEDFVSRVTLMGVDPSRIAVIENWGLLPRAEDPSFDWAAANGFGSLPLMLYTGTLSMKHNPELLLTLARALRGIAHVAVVSEGLGANWLREQISEVGLTNLIVLPYQPPNQLQAMYASADVLLAVLTEDAGQFSVPSKVLTYLCAGRPILAAMPTNNLAARIIQSENVGVVVSPDNSQGWVAAGEALLADADRRAEMGAAARTYATRQFDMDRIAPQFETILSGIEP